MKLATKKVEGHISFNHPMDRIHKIHVHGSKHVFIYCFISALYLDKCNIKFQNVPDITDVDYIIDYATYAGANLNYDKLNHELILHRGISKNRILTSYVVNCRSSLLAVTLHAIKFGSVDICSQFGGCKLGERKIDQHVKLWKALGFDVKEYNSKLILNRSNYSKSSTCKSFKLDIDTTMGSVACLMASSFGEIEQIFGLSNKPEVKALIDFLSLLKTSSKYPDFAFYIFDDIDEAVGYACLSHVLGIYTDIIAKVPRVKAIKFLEEYSLNEIIWNEDKILVRPSLNLKLDKNVYIEAGAYPKIGSDQLPILTVWASLHCNSVSVVDYKFIDRAKPLKQLEKLGWSFKKDTNNNLVVSHENNAVKGTSSLTATDLRTGFALLIACSHSRQKCIINDFEQLFRGYSRIIDQLKKVGIKVDNVEPSNHGSVAIILKNLEGKLILQGRDANAAKNPGLVSFFGGAIEQGETPIEAASRELDEELSICTTLSEINSYYINGSTYSNTGNIYIFSATISEEDICCNEGKPIICTLNEALDKNLTLFARTILERMK